MEKQSGSAGPRQLPEDRMECYRPLPEALLPWYRENRRDLPWRRDREPYHIWLSEIMLQQTRVEAVRGYYLRFLEALPTIPALAAAEEALLHKLWEGLGYYNRVRNLKKAAQQVVTQYGGVFPREYDQVLALPGIGAYTAGAICSVAYDAPTPAVDGNVLRLAARLTEDFTPVERPAFLALVRECLRAVYPPQAGDFTQALMELGATLCGPNRDPECPRCPCRDFCRGAKSGTAPFLPVRNPKRPRQVQDMTLFLLRWEDRFALEKRPDRGLLAGLWQFPNCPGTLEVAQALGWAEKAGLHPREVLRQVEKKHVFTHVQWNMRGFYLEVAGPGGGFVWMTPEEIRKNAALPTAFRQFWEEIDGV